MKAFILLLCMFTCSQAVTRPNTVIENGSGFTINVGSVVVNMFNTEKFNQAEYNLFSYQACIFLMTCRIRTCTIIPPETLL